MASIMLTAMPFAGHTLPLRTVAAELVRRGHDVRAYTGRRHTETFAEAGARPVAWRQVPDIDERHPATTFPRKRGAKGFRQMLVNVEDLFLGTAAAQTADLVALYEDEPWDLIVGDPMALGTRFAAERSGTRWATVSALAYWPPGAKAPPMGLGLTPPRGPVGRARDVALRRAVDVGAGALTRRYRRARADAGLPPDRTTIQSAWYSPSLTVAAGSPGLDYPRDDIPATVRFVGDLTDDGRPSRSGPLPEWWEDVLRSEAPVVHVTQGTENVDPTDLVLPTLEALADEDVLVVVGLGHRTAPLPGPLPANARVAPMVPYPALLPLTSVMITNGGYGGVLQALRHDVPLVVAGGDLDKPEIAAHVGWHGAGVNLRTGTPRPAAVATAYREVTTDPRYRATAARLGAELRGLGGTRAAADLLEEHLTSRPPTTLAA